MRLREKIIELLANNPRGLRQADIARILGASRSRVSEIIRELEETGIVRRVREGGIILVQLVRVGDEVVKQEYKRKLKLGIVWSSEYPFITPFAKNLRNELGIELDVIVYSNGLDATWDLVTGRIDLALTPMVTQLLYSSLTNRLKIIGGGASGGASILHNPLGREGYGASTKASTMDLLLTIAWRVLGREEKQRIYLNGGDKLLRALLRGEVELIALWEPLASKARLLGYRELISAKDLGVSHCCTLATFTFLDSRLVEKISRMYHKSIVEFLRDPSRWLEWYSIKTGISMDALKNSIHSYEFHDYIDVKGMEKALRESGVRIPNPSTLKEIVLAY